MTELQFDNQCVEQESLATVIRTGSDAYVPALNLVKKAYGRLLRTLRLLRADLRARERHRHLLASLAQATPSSILFVCYGNICRSPFAAAVADRRLAGTITVTSAGFHPVGARHAPPHICRTSVAFGIRSEQHESRVLVETDVASADLVFVMDHQNAADLLARFPAAADKMFLLGCFGPGGTEIPDPYTFNEAKTAEVLKRIDDAVQQLCQNVERGRRTSPETEVVRRHDGGNAMDHAGAYA